MGLFAATIVFLIALVIVEKKSTHPVFPTHLFGNKSFMMILMTMVFLTACSALALYMPTIMQVGFGFSATQSAIPQVATCAVTIVAAVIVGALFAKVRKAKLFLIVEVIVVMGCAVAMFLGASGISLLAICITFGAYGIAQAINQVVGYSYPSVAMKPQDIALAVGFISFSTICSATIFNSICGALFNADMYLPMKVFIVYAACMLIFMLLFKDKKEV